MTVERCLPQQNVLFFGFIWAKRNLFSHGSTNGTACPKPRGCTSPAGCNANVASVGAMRETTQNTEMGGAYAQRRSLFFNLPLCSLRGAARYVHKNYVQLSLEVNCSSCRLRPQIGRRIILHQKVIQTVDVFKDCRRSSFFPPKHNQQKFSTETCYVSPPQHLRPNEKC